MGRNKLNLWIIIIVIAIVLAGTYWYFNKSKEVRVETTEEAVEVLSQTPQVEVETNPIKKVPDLNPVEKTNPFKISNPFE